MCGGAGGCIHKVSIGVGAVRYSSHWVDLTRHGCQGGYCHWQTFITAMQVRCREPNYMSIKLVIFKVYSVFSF